MTRISPAVVLYLSLENPLSPHKVKTSQQHNKNFPCSCICSLPLRRTQLCLLCTLQIGTWRFQKDFSNLFLLLRLNQPGHLGLFLSISWRCCRRSLWAQTQRHCCRHGLGNAGMVGRGILFLGLVATLLPAQPSTCLVSCCKTNVKCKGTNHKVNWIAFVQMQPCCPPLPRDSPSLGLTEQEAALQDPDHF